MIISSECTDCKKIFADYELTECYLDGEISGKLCPNCIEHSGYCVVCGVFSAGISSFDFSPIKNTCENCVDQIRSEFGEDRDGNQDWDDYWNEDDEEDHWSFNNFEEEDFPDGSLNY